MSTDTRAAIAVVKSINRWNRKARRLDTPFAGQITRGWDYSTWRAVYPRVSSVYSQAAEIIAGRPGRFVPGARS